MKKKRNLTAQQRALNSEWEAICQKWSSVPKFARTAKVKPSVTKPAKAVQAIAPAEPPSLKSMQGSTAPPTRHQYTGTAIIGLATMHKTNIVPIFSGEQAVAVAQMRRG